MRTDSNLHSDFSVVPLCYLFSKFSIEPKCSKNCSDVGDYPCLFKMQDDCSNNNPKKKKNPAVRSRFNLNISFSLLSGEIFELYIMVLNIGVVMRYLSNHWAV